MLVFDNYFIEDKYDWKIYLTLFSQVIKNVAKNMPMEGIIKKSIKISIAYFCFTFIVSCTNIMKA